MKKKLKLFVYENFQPDYTSGLAFAIAETLEEAREMIKKGEGWEVHGKFYIPTIDWGTLHIHELDEKIMYSVCGGG